MVSCHARYDGTINAGAAGAKKDNDGDQGGIIFLLGEKGFSLGEYLGDGLLHEACPLGDSLL